MTSAQAMRHWNTYGLIPAELYEADLRRQRHTIAELQAAREYLDEARDWLKAILEEADACPHTREEWRDGLCRGSIEAVMTKCKAALSELPQGSEVVFTVRQRLADGEKAGAGGYCRVSDNARLVSAGQAVG